MCMKTVGITWKHLPGTLKWITYGLCITKKTETCVPNGHQLYS